MPAQATHPMEEFREALEEPMVAAPVVTEEALTPAVTDQYKGIIHHRR